MPPRAPWTGAGPALTAPPIRVAIGHAFRCSGGCGLQVIPLRLAQFERRLIQERTKAGLAAARARGRHGGRPRVTAAEAKVVLAKKLNADKTLDIDDVCKTLRISRSTFYRYVRM